MFREVRQLAQEHTASKGCSAICLILKLAFFRIGSPWESRAISYGEKATPASVTPCSAPGLATVPKQPYLMSDITCQKPSSPAPSPKLFMWFPAPAKATGKSKQDTFTVLPSRQATLKHTSVGPQTHR